MKVKNLTKLTVAGLAGAVAFAGTALAGSLVRLAPDQVRTQCKTDPIRRATNSLADYDGAAGATQAEFTADDDNTIAGGTEVVWSVIGSLVTPPGNESGEGYCGSLPLAGGFTFSTNDVATNIEDCIAIARFDLNSVANGDLPVHSAWLNWAGSNLGVRNTIAVSMCDYSGIGSADGDNEVPGNPNPLPAGTPNPMPDCIISTDNFGGNTFAAIHDVSTRKADNIASLQVGGAADINFADVFPVMSDATGNAIELNDLAVSKINDAADRAAGSRYVTLIVRCADEDGHENGFLGGNGGPFGAGTNALVIHDPAGIGFGFPGVLELVLNPNAQPEANDDPASFP